MQCVTSDINELQNVFFFFFYDIDLKLDIFSLRGIKTLESKIATLILILKNKGRIPTEKQLQPATQLQLMSKFNSRLKLKTCQNRTQTSLVHSTKINFYFLCQRKSFIAKGDSFTAHVECGFKYYSYNITIRRVDSPFEECLSIGS